jgi:hypothetical protein
MPYTLQMLRALMQEHPDRAERLRVHVEALEANIEGQPAFCLQNVRTLFEAAHATIAPQLGVTFGKSSGFPSRMRGVIEALDFLDRQPSGRCQNPLDDHRPAEGHRRHGRGSGGSQQHSKYAAWRFAGLGHA